MSLPPNRSLLKEYKNGRVFVETGSYIGDAIQQAIEAGYEKIISIDIDQKNIDFCKRRFDPLGVIQLICGDSAECLWDAIKDIDEPITFWLDSHWQLFEDEPKGDNPFPLLKELQQIARHPIKTHTILIDDILILTHPDVNNVTRKNIEAAIRIINPKYKISYVANPVVTNLLITEP